MSLHWQPVGPEPASTYWTRRGVVALGALIVLYGLFVLLTGGGDDDTLEGQDRPSATPSATASDDLSASASPSVDPSASAGASPSVEPSASPAAAAPCADTDLEVSAQTDAPSYSLGSKPTLVLTVRNISEQPCTRDLGQAAAELVVTSGADRIWSSDDCSPGGDPGPVVLAPGEDDVQRLTWSATRSRPGCAGEKTPVEPGTYVVSARVGELRVEGRTFRFEG